MALRLVIFEDNERLRQTLELLFNDNSGFQLVGSFPHCDDAKEVMNKLKPELVIMDIDMPGVGGIKGVKTIKSAYPEIKVVMYTVFDDDHRIFDCICAGADGYILKNTEPEKLLMMLKELMNGGAMMSPFVAQKIFQHFRKNTQAKEEFNLTKREKEILELLVKGNTYKMIASISFITVDTVKKHLKNIYHKLHVSCGTEAVVKAIQHKIVNLG
jgi:DNA-binding NarL/FixJ family response regulator